MLLKPHEILKYMGFDIPEEGIEVNGNDGYLHSETLKLIGATLDPQRIPEKDLFALHCGMAGIVAVWKKEDPAPTNQNTALKLRAQIRANLKVTYKFSGNFEPE